MHSILRWTAGLALVAGLTACGAEPETVETTDGAAPATAEAAEGAGATAAHSRMDPDAAFLKDGDTRKFSVVYTGIVKDIPEGTKRLRVWIPVPRTTPLQTITDVSVEASVEHRMTVEKRHGNHLAYLEVENPGSEFKADVAYTVSRREHLTDLDALAEDGTESDDGVKAFLEPTPLVKVDERIRKMAAEITEGKTTTLEKGRAIYDYVLAKMTYDKGHEGWGKGSTDHACDVGKGNCTDFHSLFMSLCMAEGIPCGFEIGLYPPYEPTPNAKLGGYHCWALFRIPGKTWVPVDISEADRMPERAKYFFGNHTSNRVTLSVGRELVLEPAQDGAPLNFLLNPYAEADGKPASTTKTWTLQELN